LVRDGIGVVVVLSATVAAGTDGKLVVSSNAALGGQVCAHFGQSHSRALDFESSGN
jgi:hypothetical protein